MRVLVCGSRDVVADDHVDFIKATLMRCPKDQFNVLIHGAAPGADSIAAKFAFDHGIEIAEFPAQWARFGKSAGPRRNAQMLSEGKPDVVIAFINKPLLESRGTRDMVTKAIDAKVPVHVYDLVSGQEVSLS